MRRARLPGVGLPVLQPDDAPAGVGSAPRVVSGTRIRFKSPEIERAAGVMVVRAGSAALDSGIDCAARIDFDRNRLAEISVPSAGVVRKLLVDLGDRVAAGQELFVIESARIGEQQARLTAARQRVETARANLDRQAALLEERVAARRDVELARQELEEAQAELHSIQTTLRLSGATEVTSGRFGLRSPIAGTVVRRPTVIGAFANETESLATVADTSRMWAMLDIRERDAGAIRLGQRMVLHVDGVPNRTFDGRITWIASEVDPRTRTVAARAEIDNADAMLRANQFARATIELEPAESGVAVPREAIQRVGDEHVVFVRTGPGLYEPRVVILGRGSTDLVHVHGEVRVGDEVVTTGAFLLRTELSPDAIGAGCCEVDQDRGL